MAKYYLVKFVEDHVLYIVTSTQLNRTESVIKAKYKHCGWYDCNIICESGKLSIYYCVPIN